MRAEGGVTGARTQGEAVGHADGAELMEADQRCRLFFQDCLRRTGWQAS